MRENSERILEDEAREELLNREEPSPDALSDYKGLSQRMRKKCAQFCTAVCILWFLATALQNLYADDILDVPVTVVVIPFIIGLLLLAITSMAALNEHGEATEALSKVMFINITYGSFLLTSIFAMLMALKEDKYFELDWVTIFVPLWIQLINGLIFLCYYLPNLIERKFFVHREALLTVVHYTFFIALVIIASIDIIEEQLVVNTYIYLSIFLIPLVFHVIIIFCAGYCDDKSGLSNYLWELLLLVLTLLLIVLSWMKLNAFMNSPWFLCLLPLYIIGIHFIVNSIRVATGTKV